MLTLSHAIELSVLDEAGSGPRCLPLDEQRLLASTSDSHRIAYWTTTWYHSGSSSNCR